MASDHRIPPIAVRGACAHNLQGVDLDIPHHALVVVTGVSGSGKSSLAFDTVCREGQRRYLESFSSRARQLLGKLGRPEAESITNLSPAIALDQKTSGRNPRSTVGTISDLHGYLRLLFARLGEVPGGGRLQRGDFSFNGRGACPACRGLGVRDAIDPDLLIADPARTLREGALAITTDSGYLIYSQVTMEVLDQVCRAHGFHVDIAWAELTPEQKQVVLYGSDRLEIPFGKHTLESRMKWSGITARPRQMGHYGGIIPVMEGILKRDRNKNILRFARTAPCPACVGTRLNERALSARFAGRGIAAFTAMEIGELDAFFRGFTFEPAQGAVGQILAREILGRTELLTDLGLEYLTLDRDAPSLSGGEAQRIRLATMVGSRLRGITYVLDEPSIGLHPRDQLRLLRVLRRLVDQGNSVIVVEHDQRTMRAADWIIDIGPGAGADGGRVLYAGPVDGLLADTEDPTLATSRTRAYLRGEATMPEPGPRSADAGVFTLDGACLHNLRNLGVEFRLEACNVVTGVSGAGKSSLLTELAAAAQRARAAGDPAVRKLVIIDQVPLGRTPRSNTATYTGLFDHIRSLFAAQPRAWELGLGKGDFSFNNKGGRCEACEGAGVRRLGMHFLGDVEIACEACGGRRFAAEILSVKYRGLDISEVLGLSVAAAADLFADQPRLSRILEVLVELGLGYLGLGQPSTTLSGGEAQRVKLAAELARPQVRGMLYLLDEPTTGLHAADVAVLLRALDGLVAAAGTVVVSGHNAELIRFADHVIDLGPDSGKQGGAVVYAGPPAGLTACAGSATGRALAQGPEPVNPAAEEPAVTPDQPIELFGVCTHNLRNIDVTFPAGKISVVTGVSGSGKSSLVMDTLYAEGRGCFAENFSTYIRQQLAGASQAELASSRGLMPAVAVAGFSTTTNPRSTVATMSDIHPLLRLLMSRLGVGFAGDQRPPAGFFSFNDQGGACPACRGLGSIIACDPDKLVTTPGLALTDGALDGHKTGRFYGERDGQYVATLKQVGRELGMDFSVPWRDLPAAQRRVAMNGAGDRSFAVVWRFKRGKSEGEHEFHGVWPGFCGLVDAEYERKHADRRGREMLAVMSESICPACAGLRLGPEALAVRFAENSLADLCALSVDGALAFFTADATGELATVPQLRDEVIDRLTMLQRVGLGYLGLDRSTGTLSSGEQRRLRLARQLGARLRGLICVLDEPTLGLHSRDTQRLWGVLEDLRAQGNTVVLVEHDPEVIRRADHVIDLGPGAGRLGGQVVAQGTAAQVEADPASVTGRYLRELAMAPARRPEVPAGAAMLTVVGARCNNLQNIDVEFPVGSLTAVIGVSGSGKTSLVFGALGATAAAGRPVGCDRVKGLDRFGSVIPIRLGMSAAAGPGNPATAAGVAAPLRSLLAGTAEAKNARLAARHFSTAQKGGRCETCQGTGELEVNLDFLSDVHTPCPDCGGEGFTPEVLACRWQGRNIASMLRLTVAEALEFFAGQKKIARRLQLLQDAGLSYLALGQPTRTLSGGERQRLHLACRLIPGTGDAGKSGAPDLLLCDEPTAGLHMADIRHLGGLLRRLADEGHTVIFTEHNAQLIALADRVIELGPGAGADGGRLL